MALTEKYWTDRYLNNDTGWDIGYPSTPLATYIDQLKDKSAAILIPGGGNSYEAGYLLEKGFTNITVADISALVCDTLKERYAAYIGKGFTVIHTDFFDLEGQYDLVLEQTFFCALDPSLRERYVAAMHAIIKPGGKIAGVMFNAAFEGGPPFGGNTEEYKKLFEKYFDIAVMEPCYNSIKPREGAEIFVQLVNKGE